MKQQPLYDIAEVCHRLGITSRTLRFYEAKGIISSTTTGISSRRQYTEEQLSHIKNVLVLRSLGLSVSSIAELQHTETDLKEVVLSKRAEIEASIETKIHEINLLNDALSALEAGKNIFTEEWQHAPDANAKETKIAEICARAIINDDTDTLYQYFAPRMVRYLPKDAYNAVKKDTFSPLGEFVSYDRVVIDENHPNKIYHFIKFSKLGLKITFVFSGGLISGLWLGYYDTNVR